MYCIRRLFEKETELSAFKDTKSNNKNKIFYFKKKIRMTINIFEWGRSRWSGGGGGIEMSCNLKIEFGSQFFQSHTKASVETRSRPNLVF